MPKTPRLPCLHRYCPLTFKSQHGRTYHVRSVHGASNYHSKDNGEDPANDKANGEDSASANDEANAATGEDPANEEDGDTTVDVANDRADCNTTPSNTKAKGQRIEHPDLTGMSPTVLGTLN
jgi:hypothetical protein